MTERVLQMLAEVGVSAVRLCEW